MSGLKKILRNTNMHLGITGTRKGLTEAQFDQLKEFIIEIDEVTHLHEGDCIGVDQQITIMFQDLRPDVRVICHPPIRIGTKAFGAYDETREPKGYISRDKDIVDESQYLWACPDGPERVRSGTWTTVRYARKQGLLICIIYPDGEVEYE